MTDYERQARERVKNTPGFQRYSETLLNYDWGNMEEHYKWVAEADPEEILDWCACENDDEIFDVGGES